MNTHRCALREPRAVRRSHLRSGAAAVEAALSLPLLLVLILGSMESANAVFARQAISAAAYEAARTVTKSGGTESTARSRCGEVLTAQGIRSWRLAFSPTVSDSTAGGTAIRVTVTASSDSVSLGLMPLFQGRDISRTVEMVRL